jgi:glycosyltransferase involved in cell wall biosynthesis
VLPSTLEGLSIALLEGMSYGRCCLVSDIAPNLEVSGGCAPAFASGDAGALGAAMAGLLGDPEARERHGEASRRRVLATYSWENAAVDTLALYRRVLGREKSV